jgi:diguanylate cyclase (GGDEF)-like protein
VDDLHRATLDFSMRYIICEMNLMRFQPRSLKNRVILLTLIILTVCLVPFAMYALSLMRDELLKFSGEQQRSALALLTNDVTRQLQDRINILDTVAARVTPTVINDPLVGQTFLLERPFLGKLFNGGVMLWGPRGQMLTDLSFKSLAAVREPLQQSELARVLADGQATVGTVHRDLQLQVGVFAIAVPIRNAQGAVIGALGGAVRLDQPNFLTSLTETAYGKTGNFFLIEPRERLIFASSDTSRVMEVLPQQGINPWIDRFVQGFEGTARVVNPHGVEVLVSVKQIQLPHWYASITLSPGEVFSLISVLQSHTSGAALGLFVLVVSLVGWMLRAQLSPITTAAETLAGFNHGNQPAQALPVVRNDEVGEMVIGFNTLLNNLLMQQKKTKDGELFLMAVLDSVTAEIAVLDHDGVILAVNASWKDFSLKPVLVSDRRLADTGVGTHFLAVCQSVETEMAPDAPVSAAAGIQKVLNRELPHFYVEYPCHTATLKRWFSIHVTALKTSEFQGAVVSHEDITVHIQMAEMVREQAFYDPLTLLPNRRLVMERLEQQMARARRTQSVLALLFIDLDEFKPVNDAFGHETGDWMLRTVAQRIQQCLRESDTVGRIGGDEFIALLPDLMDGETAIAVANKIRVALAQEFVTAKGQVMHVSSSIGVALYPEHAQTDTDLLRLADEAMYRAKRAGRNAVVLCESVSDDANGSFEI